MVKNVTKATNNSFNKEEYAIVKEGSVCVLVPKETKISKQLPVFYNSVMKFNRDISILILNALDKKEMHIGLPLAGTGIRGIRFIKELNSGIVKSLAMNDLNPTAVQCMKENCKLNNIDESTHNISVHNQPAHLFLGESRGFSYIDVDPFGTPNQFLDAAIQKILSEGVLAVTATDTSSLAGTYPDVCRRRYWAVPLSNPEMHEVGVRILIRKCQLVAVQYEKVLTPIFSFSKDHYMRIFFSVEKGKKRCDAILKQHGLYKNAGPLWLGKLWDSPLVEKMIEENKKSKLVGEKFLQHIKSEASIDTVGFYDIHALCKGKRTIPNYTTLIETLEAQGYTVARTHFNPYGLKVAIDEEKFLKIVMES